MSMCRYRLPGRAYTIEGGSWFERAHLLVHWRFEALSERRARLTQRLELCGENAATYVEGVRASFEPHLESGMRRIAERMTRAAGTDERARAGATNA